MTGFVSGLGRAFARLFFARNWRFRRRRHAHLMETGRPAIVAWQPADPATLVACVALGPVAVIAQYCTKRGYSAAPLSVIGPVDCAWLVFAALLGLAAFGGRVDHVTLVGCALIVTGGVLLAHG